jgi:CheY-like chemotaxis protein
MYILVADDDKFVRDILVEFLIMLGHTVHITTNGQEAWESFVEAKDKFDIVISDIAMPQVDGLSIVA